MKRPLSADASSDDDSQVELPSQQQSTQQSRSRRGGRGKKSKLNTVSVASMKEAIDTVANGSSSSDSQSDAIVSLKCEVRDLRSIISQQSSTIDKLSCQLSFILSYLELNDESVNASPTLATSSSTSSSTGGSAVSVPTIAPLPSGPVKSLSSLPDGGSWTTVQRHKTPAAGVRRTATVATAAVAAVYAEEAERKRRSTSVVVSGLPPVSSTSDDQLFSDLCHTQLNIDTVIVGTKRLGPAIPGRIQPLLVSLRNHHTAHHLLDVARNLRKSSDVHIRDRVYINPNRTRAEAEAAYQQRLRRRLSAQRKSPVTMPIDLPSNSLLSSAPPALPMSSCCVSNTDSVVDIINIATTLPISSSTAATDSSLSVNAVVFKPTTSSE